MSGRAWISDCGTYRYALLRCIELDLLGKVDNQRALNVVMLNPSTADATADDPTIRRCMGYARRWGYGELMVTNLFAFRATDPRDLKRPADPIGPDNDDYLRKIAGSADLILAAWGVHGAHFGRDAAVLDLLREVGKPLHCLGTSKQGHPKHPLYLRADLQPIPYACAQSPEALT